MRSKPTLCHVCREIKPGKILIRYDLVPICKECFPSNKLLETVEYLEDSYNEATDPRTKNYYSDWIGEIILTLTERQF